VFTFGPLQNPWILSQLSYSYNPNQAVVPAVDLFPVLIIDIPLQIDVFLQKYPENKRGMVFWCHDENMFARIKQYIDHLGPPSHASQLPELCTPAKAEAEQLQRLEIARKSKRPLQPLHNGHYWWVRRSFRIIGGKFEGPTTYECRVFLWVEDTGDGRIAGGGTEKTAEPERWSQPGPSRLAYEWNME
jgi:hypothetical protein